MNVDRTPEAENIIKNATLYATGSGLIPLPGVDFAVVTWVQLNMLNNLSELYGKRYSESRARILITSLAGGLLTRAGASAIKLIPGVGTILGGVSAAIANGGTTYAIGKVINRHYADGGDLYDFNAEMFREYFNQQYERGKEYADDMRDKAKEKARDYWKTGGAKKQAPPRPGTGADADTAAERLREFAQMRDEGVITEAEYQNLKQKILNEL